MTNERKELLDTIAQAIFDKKGSNILAIDVREISSITDYFLIAEGTVERHTVALCDEICSQLKEKGETPFKIDGRSNGDWIVIDLVDVVIHIFTPAMREKYQLEKLWQEGKIVDLSIQLPNLKS